MSKISVRAECCLTCRHWQCRSRRVVGDPPNEVETYSDYNMCSLCRSGKEWRECCDSYVNFHWLRNTYRPSREETRTIGEAFTDSLMEFYGARRRTAETSRPQKVTRTCSRCGGSGRISCGRCGGSGKECCGCCDGEGGFVIELEMREDYERFDRTLRWTPDRDMSEEFYFGDGGGTTPDAYETRQVLCDKNVGIPFGGKVVTHAKDALMMSEAGFDFPEGMSEETKKDILQEFDRSCKRVDERAKNWGADYRIKEASVKCTQVPCIVHVTFKDENGFPRTALINLANEKVHLYEVDKDLAKERMAELEELAAAGDVNMQNLVGQLYGHFDKHSQVVDKDYARALKWFMKAGKAGCIDAMDSAGMCFRDAQDGVKDLELAVHWFMKAAKAGSKWGQLHLAECFYGGVGVEEDYDLAFLWYLKAAKQDLKKALYMVGVCFEKGRGTEHDEDMAFLWYMRAAKKGFARSMYEIGRRYRKGLGCERNSELAEAWTQKAKENGYEPPVW